MEEAAVAATSANTPPLTVAALDAVLDGVGRVRAQARGRPTFAFDEPWDVFIRCMALLSPQSYGSRIQNRLAAAFGWTTVPAAEDRGDVIDTDGQFHEVKVTIISPTNCTANFVQLRPHQQIDGYHLFVVDEDYQVTHLHLSAAEMAAEIDRRSSSAHGCAAAVTANATREYAIHIPWGRGSAEAARWVERYSRPVTVTL